MADFSERVNNGLEKLTEKFKTALPFRIKEIVEALANAEGSSWSESGIESLKLLVHRLAGSGATFDCEDISAKTKEIEKLLNRIQENLPPDSGSIKELHAIIADIEAEYLAPTEYTYLDKIGTDNKPVEYKKPDSHKVKIISLNFGNDSIFRDIFSQFGFFGYCIEQVEKFSELNSILHDNEKQLLIVNSSALGEFPELEKELKDVKSRFLNFLSIIFISRKEDFDLRLSCVRAGGDDFLKLPVDIVRVIDRIDELSSSMEGKPYHILIVDDDLEQLSYYAMILQQANMITSVATDPRLVLNILSETKPDLIIMDMYMPNCDGPELAAVIRQEESFVSIPIVFLSIEADRGKQLAAVGLGGDDFIKKPVKSEHLISSIRTRVERSRSVRFFMERDSLTGLFNHSNLKEQLSHEILKAERTNSNICFAMIDLDHFKVVNDTYGHLTGDKVLKSLSRLLQERLRRTDLIGRYGGEEFGVVLINTSLEDAGILMNKMREGFSQIRHKSGDKEFFVTFSCGISSFPEIKTNDEIASEADKALYRAKENGRNQIVLAGVV